MPVVAVINRKGGSGKSTLATNLAGFCASTGLQVMLGDVDRQQSSLGWLRRRASQSVADKAAIVGWAVDTKNVLRPPAGITHVILDTPGGLRGFDLARVVNGADAILMPVCDSAFDRESAVECHAELMTLQRVSSGRCKVATVGMRIDARTKGSERLQAWATEHGLPYLGSVRESQLYVRNAEQGLTLFDHPAAKVEADLAQWQPILDWMRSSWKESERARAAAVMATPCNASRSASLPPVHAPSKPVPLGAPALRVPMGAPSQPVPMRASSPPVPVPVRAPSPPAAPSLERLIHKEFERAGSGDRFGWLLSVFRSPT
jgi:chromosome partitioning protein